MSGHAVIDIREDLCLPAALMPDHLVIEVNEPNLTITLPPAAEVLRIRSAQTVMVVNAEGITGTRVVVPRTTVVVTLEQVQQRMAYVLDSDGLWYSVPDEPGGPLASPPGHGVDDRIKPGVESLWTGETAADGEDKPPHDRRTCRIVYQVLAALTQHFFAVLRLSVSSVSSDWSCER